MRLKIVFMAVIAVSFGWATNLFNCVSAQCIGNDSICKNFLLGDSVCGGMESVTRFAEQTKLQVYLLKVIPKEYEGNYLIVKGEFDGKTKTKIMKLTSKLEDDCPGEYEKIMFGKDNIIALVKQINDYSKNYFGYMVYDSDNRKFYDFNMGSGFFPAQEAKLGQIYNSSDDTSDSPNKKPILDNILNIDKVLEKK